MRKLDHLEGKIDTPLKLVRGWEDAKKEEKTNPQKGPIGDFGREDQLR